MGHYYNQLSKMCSLIRKLSANLYYHIQDQGRGYLFLDGGFVNLYLK